MDTDSEAASDMQSDEGYGSQEDYMEESSDDEDADYGFDGAAEMLTFSQRAQYKVLNKADMERRRKEAIEGVTGILGITEEEAARVLRKYKWDVRRVHEEWFADTAAVRTSVGLVDEAPQTSKAEETCLVCFDTLPLRAMRCAACRHYFCLDCWRCYVQTAVGSGPSCLDLRCPFRGRTEKDKCIAAVPTALVQEVLPLEDLAKYEVFQMRSFVEDNRGMSWCTGKGCENAVECRVDRAVDEALDVICTCGTTFCFNCKEEAHRPVSCHMVRQWITKNASESENMNWILANTKPCPKCHRPIEKNQGCMHMTCSQCRYEFCWLCNGDWKEHGERTGGFYNCNRYEVAKKKGEYDDVAKRRDHAKASLERYMHYFERFDAHSRARDKARADAATVSRDWLETLSDATKTPTSQLKFIMDAWAQIIECRRQLKWTYAYGFYSFENESDAQIKRQREFFEFLQGDAERSLDRLHEYAETDLKRHKDGNLGIEAFQEFRKKLIGMTDVTHTFFDKLVKQLERGFDDLAKDFAGQEPEVAPDAGQGASSSSGAGTSRAASNGKANNRAADARTTKRGRGAGAANAGDAAARAAGAVEDDELTGQLLQEQGFWTCSHCTMNNALTARVCEVCESPRQ